MSERTDALVIGGGLVGLTSALALRAAGLGVVLVDGGAAHDPRWSAVSHAALRALKRLGVSLAEGAQPILSMVVTEGPSPSAAATPWAAAAALQLDSPAAEPNGEPLGWMVQNSAVVDALRTALLRSGVEAAEARVTELALGDAEAHSRLSGGREFGAQVVVGADGRGSRTRVAMDVGVERHSYGRSGIVATVALSRPHGGVARQLFLPGGPLAILPLPRDRASLVWTVRHDQAIALKSMPARAFEALLARRLGDGVGAAALEGPRASFPLELQLAERLAGRRAALVGDAAHAIHPVAGQGLNLGLKDAFALAEVVGDGRRLGEDWGSEAVLMRYARWRRLDRAALAGGADLFARAFGSGDPVVRLARRLGFAAAGASPPLRQLAMREASGTLGQLPRLMQEEAPAAA